MLSMTVILVCACACGWVSSVAENRVQPACLWQLDRGVCAMPSEYWDSKGSKGRDCIVGLKMNVRLRSNKCQHLNLENITFSHGVDTLENLEFLVTQNAFNDSKKLHSVYLNLSAQQIVKRLKLKPNSQVSFRFNPRYDNRGCAFSSSSSSCRFAGDESNTKLILNLNLDHAPIVKFEKLKSVVNKELTGAALIKRITEETVALTLNRSVDSLLLIANVQDDDVFINNTDAYEYSAISKLTVNISAVVQFFNNSREEDAAGDADLIELQLVTGSGNCQQVPWCEDIINSTVSKNRALVQLRFSVPELYSAVQALEAESKLSALSYVSNPASARVVITIDATATSGTTNALTGKGKYTLTAFLQKPLEKVYKPPTLGFLSLLKVREKFEHFVKMSVAVNNYFQELFSLGSQTTKK